MQDDSHADVVHAAKQERNVPQLELLAQALSSAQQEPVMQVRQVVVE